MSVRVPKNETKRLEALHLYALLDTPAEQSFDDFAYLASYICETPIAMVSLVDKDRQWFKAKIGIKATETPREQAFCSHAILDDHLMIVEDALEDKRFTHNPLVESAPHIRFYAGAPLTDHDGYALGTLCVIDRKPRRLAKKQQRALEALARQVVVQCEFRRASSELAAALSDVKTLRGLLPICSHCKNIRNDKGYWRSVESYIVSQTEANLTHGICPECIKLHYPDCYEELFGKKKA